MARTHRLVALALAVVPCVACERGKAGGSDGGTAPTSPSVEATPGPASAAQSASAVGPIVFAAVEASRTRIAKLDEIELLAANAPAIVTHFGGALPQRIAVQMTDLPSNHRRALLLYDDTKPIAESTPFALSVAADDTAVFTKERPAAGIKAPVGPLAIAPGPEGRIALAVCDPPTSTVALRLWDADGSPFADIDAMETDTCDALSLLYLPKRGWLVVVAKAGATRAQLVSENGRLTWQRGVEIGARPNVASGVSLASDTDASFIVIQRFTRPGDREHALAFRYDDHATALFAAPVDLGETKLAAGERIVLARPRAGVVRATLGPRRTVDLAQTGEILR